MSENYNERKGGVKVLGQVFEGPPGDKERRIADGPVGLSETILASEPDLYSLANLQT